MAVRQYVYRVDKVTKPFDSWDLNEYDGSGWELVSCVLNYGTFDNYNNCNSIPVDGHYSRIPVPNLYIYTFRRRFDHTVDKQ